MSLFLRQLAAGVVTMLAMGILYLWGVFLLGLEHDLDLPRSALSVASSIALVACTCGFLIYDRLLQKLSLQVYLAMTYALAASGHLLFGFFPGYATLLVGYGAMFGLAVGLGYGLALALAARSPDASRGVAISLVVSAFAMSGVALGALAPVLFANSDTATAFLRIGVALVAFWAVSAALLVGAAPFAAVARSADFRLGLVARSPLFLKLGVVFFVFNYCGLMLVAHGAALLKQAGFSPETAALSPVILNLSYIAGSLIGGRAGEMLSPRKLLFAVLSAVAAALLLLLSSNSIYALGIGIAIVGAAFGGAAAFTPVLIGRFWGAARINSIYGVMLLAYGGGGVLAPLVSAALFNTSTGYAVPLWVAFGLCLVGSVAVAGVGGMRPSPARGA